MLSIVATRACALRAAAIRAAAIRAAAIRAAAIRVRIVAAVVVAFAPIALRAQPVPPECLTVYNALLQMYTTPNHKYLTQTTTSQPQKSDKIETIVVGDALYIMRNGRWIKSPVAPSVVMQDHDELSGKGTSCHKVRDESVGGVAAAVYQAHNKTEENTSDGQYWVAKASGLLLRSEIDIDSADDGKSHVSMRAEFSGVKAPVVTR